MVKSKSITCCFCGKKLSAVKFLYHKKPFCQNCYLKFQDISSTKFNRQQLLAHDRVHIDDPLAITNLSNILKENLISLYNQSQQDLIIVCIGTDRSTGDSLGPLIGSKLANFRLDNKVKILGTLDSPVHATNLKEKINIIQNNYYHPFIIAVDAGLGKNSSVGAISVNDGPLKPGSGVNKKLPEIGDIHITGLVNVSGYMEYFVLQSTRLNLVMKMSKIISYSIIQSLRKIFRL